MPAAPLPTAPTAATAFPPGFLWGAATSAYQIEGSPLADGAGVSNWHRFAHTPGRVRDGDTGDVACDHYRRMPDDVALMQALGLQAYRFSVAWSRVLPEGTGRVNAAGLGFYDRLVDSLLAAGIQPLLTLHHWDWPAALDDRGGWLNPDSAGWFADYARVVARALGDRVPSWATFNEPWVITDGGFLHGTLAPGHRSAWEAAIAARHLMVAHGAGVQALRAAARGWQGWNRAQEQQSDAGPRLRLGFSWGSRHVHRRHARSAARGPPDAGWPMGWQGFFKIATLLADMIREVSQGRHLVRPFGGRNASRLTSAGQRKPAFTRPPANGIEAACESSITCRSRPTLARCAWPWPRSASPSNCVWKRSGNAARISWK